MRFTNSVAVALSMLACTIFGAPAFAQAPSAYHQGIIAPGNCFSSGEGDSVFWTTYDGHHVLSLNHGAMYGNIGFVLFGNRNAVLHGQIPQTAASAGPLPTGTFTFQVAVAGPASAEPYLATYVHYTDGSTGVTNVEGKDLTSGQTVTIYLQRNPATGAYPAALFVYFNNANAEAFHAVFGNFLLNGVPLPGTVDQVNRNNSTNSDFTYCPLL